MRVVPVVASILCVAAMYLVAEEAAPSRRHALFAAGFYAALTAMTDILSQAAG